MKNNKTFWMVITAAALMAAPAIGQKPIDMQQLKEEMKAAQKAMKDAKIPDLNELNLGQIQAEIDSAAKLLGDINLDDLKWQIKAAKPFIKDFDLNMNDLMAQIAPVAPLAPMAPLGPVVPIPPIPAIAPRVGIVAPDMAFAPRAPGIAMAPQTPQAERAQEAAERAREAQERVREAADRLRENDDRMVSWYRAGTDSIDGRKYERAIEFFDRVINGKWSRADGAYYWKAYALNKLGRRDEAVATLAEISKQFPQSRWINDAKALQVEIQQASGQPVSPESMSEEDMKLLAMSSVLNSDPDRAIPLIEKVINDPKNNLSIKGRALYLLAQSRSDKAREIVAQYAKNGSNQDLQIRALGYVASFRMPNTPQILSDAYSATNDPAVKRAVIRDMGNARDAQHLLSVAKSEQNQDLRREAIRNLGNMQAVNELAQLYPAETSADLKQAIIDAIANARGLDKVVEIARGEKDPTVRSYAIRRLGYMRGPQAGGEQASQALVTIYKAESDKNIKTSIIRALWQSGACPQLVDVARNEQDAELKSEAVRNLGRMKGCKEATDLMMEIINK
jgi:TolA-binding protein